MNRKTHKLRDAIAIALLASAGGTTVASAQEAATNLDRVEVTGSRIKRAEIEGPNPITVISRQDIEVSGELSVADFLRNNVYNSYGSARESSGSNTGSISTFSMRGLGSEYTLVLLDGRRMTKSASADGAAANINLIPTAAIERIEILREGAGAIYGADAIGGVVNVILRKDYEGLTVSVGHESPDGPGPDASSVAVSGGISSDRGNVTFVIDHAERDLMYNRDILPILAKNGYSATTPACPPRS
jgi:Outer membrane receptor for ferrienterochelin and colicins